MCEVDARYPADNEPLVSFHVPITPDQAKAIGEAIAADVADAEQHGETHCPKCAGDLTAYEVACDWAAGTHRYECACGAVVTVTVPAPGLFMTRQDATYQP